MAVFTKKIITAYYMDAGYTTIEVVYEEGKETTTYILEADPNDQDYKDLLADGWTVEQLVDATAEYKRVQSLQFDSFVNQRVNELLAEREKALREKEQMTYAKLSAYEQDLKAKLSAREQETKAKLSAREQEVKAKLSAREQEVKNKEQETKAKLSAREQEVKAKLSAREQEVKAKLSAREQEVKTKLSAREQEVKTKLSLNKEKIEKIESEIVARKQDLKEVEKDGETWMLTWLWNNNESKEYLFKFKLWALELDVVKKAPKDIKTKLRKCKTVMEGFSIIHYDIENDNVG